MTSFKRLNTQKYLKAARIQTEDTVYWKKLSVSIPHKFQFLGYETKKSYAMLYF